MTEKNAIFTVGRRKTSVARVKIMPGEGKVVVNGLEAANYFTVPRMLQHALAGLTLVGVQEKYNLQVRVHGGGVSGQAGALRLGIARAIEKMQADLRKPLKRAGLFTRDPRMVERKKFGLHKARRGTQFSKR